MKKYQHAMQVAKDFPDFATGPQSLSDPGRRECTRLADELYPETPSAANTLIDYMHTARWVLANNPALADEVLAGRVPLTDARRRVGLDGDAGCEPVPAQTPAKADAPKCGQCGNVVTGNVSGEVTCGLCLMVLANRAERGEPTEVEAATSADDGYRSRPPTMKQRKARHEAMEGTRQVSHLHGAVTIPSVGAKWRGVPIGGEARYGYRRLGTRRAGLPRRKGTMAWEPVAEKAKPEGVKEAA